MEHSPSIITQAALVAFFLAYIYFLTRSAARNGVDLYDYVVLSCVALFPLVFGLFPGITSSISHSIGVAFPFVVLFGGLFVVIFGYLHRLLVQVNRQAQLNKRLVQEISLLKGELESIKSK